MVYISLCQEKKQRGIKMKKERYEIKDKLELIDRAKYHISHSERIVQNEENMVIKKTSEIKIDVVLECCDIERVDIKDDFFVMLFNNIKDIDVFNTKTSLNILFRDCTFKDVSFKNISKCKSIILSSSTLDNCYFKDINIDLLDVGNCSFNKLNAFHMSFSRFRFNGCLFRGGYIQECEVIDSVFRDCTFWDFTMFDSTVRRNRFSSCGLMHFQCSIKNKGVICENYFDKNCVGFHMTCPEEGSFFAYKGLRKGKVAKLFIPARAWRTGYFQRKCRCSEAYVVDIFSNIDENIHCEDGTSIYDPSFVYQVGKTIKVDNVKKKSEKYVVCGAGIHFFMTKREAIDYTQK